MFVQLAADPADEFFAASLRAVLDVASAPPQDTYRDITVAVVLAHFPPVQEAGIVED